MFFQGSLQEGISLAVQQSKLVVCFVTDEGAESQEWETEYLTDDDLSASLASHAVTLRLLAGSEGAKHLAAIFPLPKTPTLVMIKNGTLKEYIAAGVAKEDFIRRAVQACEAEQAPTAVPTAEATTSSSGTNTPSSAEEPANTNAAAAPANTTTGNTAATNARIQTFLAERAVRIEAQRKKDAEEAAKRRAEKAKAKEEEAKDPSKPAAAATSQSKYADQQRKRRLEEREERARVLKAIEDDKAARKARAAERAAERELARQQQKEVEGGGEEDGPGGEKTAAPASELPSTTARDSPFTSLQVRLFDGSTLRSRFPSTEPLASVREWVDENRGRGGEPYSFKVVLTPLPNRAIDFTEEGRPLAELGLAPSATLVLVPAEGDAANAYPGSRRGIVGRFVATVVGVFAWIASVFVGLFSSFLGRRPEQQQQPQRSGDADNAQAQASGRDSTRIKGFRNPADRQDTQFYNGNSLSFEPRKDDEDDDEQ